MWKISVNPLSLWFLDYAFSTSHSSHQMSPPELNANCCKCFAYCPTSNNYNAAYSRSFLPQPPSLLTQTLWAFCVFRIVIFQVTRSHRMASPCGVIGTLFLLLALQNSGFLLSLASKNVSLNLFLVCFIVYALFVLTKAILYYNLL